MDNLWVTIGMIGIVLVVFYFFGVRPQKKQEQAVAASQESVKLAQARYSQGLASYYEVLTAQQALFPAQTQLAAYRYQYAACVPTLYTQLGGGWQNK